MNGLLAISNNGVFAGSALPLPFAPVTMCWVMKLPLNTALYDVVLMQISNILLSWLSHIVSYLVHGQVGKIHIMANFRGVGQNPVK